MTNKERMAEFEVKISAKIDQYNNLMKDGTQLQLTAIEEELKTLEADYKALAEIEMFGTLADMESALKTLNFETIVHKRTVREGVFCGYEKANKTVQIDLYKFAKYKGYNTDWFYELQALNKRLTLKVALSLGLSTDQIRKINDSYSMERYAEDIDLGKTPDSDTQCVKHMQKIFDLLDAGAGKVNSHDLGYVLACYTKKSRESLKVRCSNHKLLQSIMTDVYHRVLTNGKYDIEYKTKKDVVTTPDPTPETKTTKTKKAKADKEVKVAKEITQQA